MERQLARIVGKRFNGVRLAAQEAVVVPETGGRAALREGAVQPQAVHLGEAPVQVHVLLVHGADIVVGQLQRKHHRPRARLAPTGADRVCSVAQKKKGGRRKLDNIDF